MQREQDDRRLVMREFWSHIASCLNEHKPEDSGGNYMPTRLHQKLAHYIQNQDMYSGDCKLEALMDDDDPLFQDVSIASS